MLWKRAKPAHVSTAELQELKAKSQFLEEEGLKKDSVISELRVTVSEETKAKVEAQTLLSTERKNLEEQKQLLDQAKENMEKAFQALSGEALRNNNQAFIALAQSSLQGVLNSATGAIGQKQEALKHLVEPLEKTLEQFQRQVQSLENKRETAYGSLSEQVKLLHASQEGLKKETGNLVTALRKPQVRGKWGQMSLQRLVELSGMSEHCDYMEQVAVKTDDGRLQPDMVVHLPGGRQLVIDSKVALEAYLDGIEATDEEVKQDCLVRHAQQVRKHMNDLSSKAYWSQFKDAPDYVIMFIPGEPFVSAALEEDRTLLEDGVANKVIIASPTALISLLHAIAHGWRQEQMAKSAQIVADLGKQTYERFAAFLGHLHKVRNSLEQSIYNFNRMVGSLEGRVLPSLRKFKELGATGGEELPVVEEIEQVPRHINQKENQEPLGITDEKVGKDT
ncbi:MAG TPA: DNA recombination protein RmuC [Candidatus Omnitrophota bacterium]|nr:DNA recombination protein RmuC [Candidatus Omnitrophota bacterium]